jgi:hypothetical protein
VIEKLYITSWAWRAPLWTTKLLNLNLSLGSQQNGADPQDMVVNLVSATYVGLREIRARRVEVFDRIDATQAPRDVGSVLPKSGSGPVLFGLAEERVWNAVLGDGLDR